MFMEDISLYLCVYVCVCVCVLSLSVLVSGPCWSHKMNWEAFPSICWKRLYKMELFLPEMFGRILQWIMYESVPRYFISESFAFYCKLISFLLIALLWWSVGFLFIPFVFYVLCSLLIFFLLIFSYPILTYLQCFWMYIFTVVFVVALEITYIYKLSQCMILFQ